MPNPSLNAPLEVVPTANGNGLDKVLLAGREGINILWYDPDSGSWKYEQLGNGLAATPGNPYWGAGSGKRSLIIAVTFPLTNACRPQLQ
jgi:hypothetical protein